MTGKKFIYQEQFLMPTSENTHWTAVVYLCMCASVVLDLVFFFSTMPRDWLRRTSPKWPILCRVGCKTLTQPISQSSFLLTP